MARSEVAMRTLVLSSLFPSRTRPNFGVFVRDRVRHVAAHCDIVVVAPVPWFPGNRWLRGTAHARTPFVEEIDGLTVYHPRVVSVPHVAKALDATSYAVSLLPFIAWLRRRFRFDLVDAQFGYPDGVAAALIGKAVRCPVVVTLRGDEERVAAYPLRRMQLARAFKSVRLIAVSDSLRQFALRLGIDPSEVRVIPNGVDVSPFRPGDRGAARRRLGLPDDKAILLAVGAMGEGKGHHLVLEALPDLVARHPQLLYVAVGGAAYADGYATRVRHLVERHALQDHVRLVGLQPHEDIPLWMAAADVFCLATAHEGWSNAITEALACGLPVVTTRVGGNAELVREGRDGLLVPFGDRHALAAAIVDALQREWDRAGIAARAREFSWEATAQQVIEFMQGCRGARR